jgi:hypothetical protein
VRLEIAVRAKRLADVTGASILGVQSDRLEVLDVICGAKGGRRETLNDVVMWSRIGTDHDRRTYSAQWLSFCEP